VFQTVLIVLSKISAKHILVKKPVMEVVQVEDVLSLQEVLQLLISEPANLWALVQTLIMIPWLVRLTPKLVIGRSQPQAQPHAVPTLVPLRLQAQLVIQYQALTFQPIPFADLLQMEYV